MQKLITLLLFWTNFVHSQNQTWTFGRNIKFSPPITTTTSTVNHNEGTSCLSDASGQIRAYSDGINVYNRNDLIMSNGAGLTGTNSSAQSAIIVQQPNVPNILYIFTLTNSGLGPLYYSVIDMNLNAGLGGVTAAKNVVLNAAFNMRECLSAVTTCSQDTVWIVTKRWQSANFYAYPLTVSGVGAAVISSAGYAGGVSATDAIGTLAFHPDGNRLSVTYYGNGRAETYRFNKVTGQVQFIASYLFGGAYDSKWSENLLYVFSNGGQINQVNVCTGTSILVGQTPEINASLGTGWYADDGSIYISRGIQTFLARINNPLVQGAGCGFVANAVTLPRNSMFGLQNISMPYVRSEMLPFTYSSSCAQANLNAVPRTCFEPCTYRWSGSFGTANGINAVVNLPNGIHNVTLSRICDCETTTRVQSVNVSGGLLASVIGF
jgi:hypothetical protein